MDLEAAFTEFLLAKDHTAATRSYYHDRLGKVGRAKLSSEQIRK